MANSAAGDNGPQKVAVVALARSSKNASFIMQVLYEHRLGRNPVIDANSLIDSANMRGGRPDCRHGDCIAGQRAVISNPAFAATVVEGLKQSTLSFGDCPIHVRVSDGTTVAAVVSDCEVACLNRIRSVKGWTYLACCWYLGDIDDNEVEPTIAAIINWCRTPSPIVGPPRHFGPLFLGRNRSVLEQFGFNACARRDDREISASQHTYNSVSDECAEQLDILNWIVQDAHPTKWDTLGSWTTYHEVLGPIDHEVHITPMTVAELIYRSRALRPSNNAADIEDDSEEDKGEFPSDEPVGRVRAYIDAEELKTPPAPPPAPTRGPSIIFWAVQHPGQHPPAPPAIVGPARPPVIVGPAPAPAPQPFVHRPAAAPPLIVHPSALAPRSSAPPPPPPPLAITNDDPPPCLAMPLHLHLHLQCLSRRCSGVMPCLSRHLQCLSRQLPLYLQLQP